MDTIIRTIRITEFFSGGGEIVFCFGDPTTPFLQGDGVCLGQVFSLALNSLESLFELQDFFV
jgi:hypothetical protein